MSTYRVRLLIGTILGFLLLAGCNTLELEKSISLETVDRGSHQTEVTIHYTVPYPPPGKIYVLWILNPADHEVVNAGQIPGGRNLTARAIVPFEATGAVVSIEDEPNPPHMSSTWALKVGSVTPETPTPRAASASGTVSPPNSSTPSASSPGGALTPAAASTPAVSGPQNQI